VPSGERRASAKLTRAQVHRLRAEYVGQPLRQLAAQYGIAPSTVYAILRGAKWRRDTRGVDIFRQQPTRRLSPALVREIRTRHAAGERARDLARAYGVHESSLSLLVRRLSYRAA
jgi:Mor family transcriptional regulator